LNMINYACEHVNWAVSVILSATLLLLLSLCPPPPAGHTGYYVGNGLLLWMKCSSQHWPYKIWVHCMVFWISLLSLITSVCMCPQEMLKIVEES
jgi:hypothetical protein